MAWWLWVGLGLLLLLVVYYEIMRVMRRKLYPKIAGIHSVLYLGVIVWLVYA